MFTNLNGDRTGVDNIVVIMTDGNSNINSEDTVPLANSLVNQGVRVMTVGIGSAMNRGELDSMASSPESENTFTLEDASQIATVAGDILDQICA